MTVVTDASVNATSLSIVAFNVDDCRIGFVERFLETLASLDSRPSEMVFRLIFWAEVVMVVVAVLSMEEKVDQPHVGCCCC